MCYVQSPGIVVGTTFVEWEIREFGDLGGHCVGRIEECDGYIEEIHLLSADAAPIGTMYTLATSTPPRCLARSQARLIEVETGALDPILESQKLVLWLGGIVATFSSFHLHLLSTHTLFTHQHLYDRRRRLAENT